MDHVVSSCAISTCCKEKEIQRDCGSVSMPSVVDLDAK